MNRKESILKFLIALLILCTTVFSETIQLKEGWNLIGIPSEDSATIFESNSDIELVTGGGAAGSSMFYMPNISSNGNFVLGQGYWIKASNDTTLSYTKKTTLPSTIQLFEGWNLIYPFTEMSISDFASHPEITLALGGGVGNTNSFFYMPGLSGSAVTLPNQGYWVKVSSNIVLTFKMYDYRAWGVGGDTLNSKANIRVNGVTYTVFAYSMLDIEQSNANTGGNVVVVTGDLNGKSFNALALSEDYIDQNLQLKVFESDTLFDETTFVSQSDVKLVSNNQVDFSNLTFNNPNDYSVPVPTDTSIEMPPASPVF